jgi:microcystin degradation protein MlrC
MRVFTASLAVETNTFSPMLTGKEAFFERSHFPPGKHPDHPILTASPLWILRRVGKEKGWTVIEGLVTSAQPAGTIVRKVYEEFRDDILSQLKAAMPVDMVILGLHGAMVADGYDDCEGDILKRVRDIVGPKVVVSAELDPHCHLTDLMVSSADLLIAYKEFPHTDYLERAEELVAISEQIAKKKVKLTPAVYDCRMINSYPTSREPMRSYVDRISAMEGKNGIVSISVAHCYPYADVADVGTKILVYTDNDPAKAAKLAKDLGQELIGLRDTVRPAFLSIDQALDKGVAANSGPVVIAEPADNAGGGAPSDSTFVLKRMIERGIRDAAIAPIWDPIAVKQCFAAGAGGKFDLRFGGKMGPFSGTPVDGKVTVIKCVRNATQSQGSSIHYLGDAAAIEVEGIAVILITNRQQAWGPDLFSNMGVDPTKRKIVVVKSTNHFFAEYSKIAADVLYMDGPGALPRDFKLVPYTKIRRPIWPLDANPWA